MQFRSCKVSPPSGILNKNGVRYKWTVRAWDLQPCFGSRLSLQSGVPCPARALAVLTTSEPAICSQISAVSLASSTSESCHQSKLEFLDFLLTMRKP